MTGSISAVSSITIIAMLLRSTKALSITYHRILLVLSIIDIVVSLGLAPGRFLAGNQYTCLMQGILVIFGSTAGPLCNCSLQLYYLLVIRYKMKAEDMSKRVEPFLLLFPVMYGIIGAATCAFTQSINRTEGFCYIELAPLGCDDNSEVECNRGNNILLLRLLFGAIPIFASFIFMTIAMRMIYCAVREKERATNRLTFRVSSSTSDRFERNGNVRGNSLQQSSIGIEQKTKSRKMLKRIQHYYLTFFLAQFFALLNIFVRTFAERKVLFAILHYIFFPLQGFYTLLVFIHPRFVAVRTANEDLTLLRAFLVAIQTYGGAVNPNGEIRRQTPPTGYNDGRQSSTRTVVSFYEEDESPVKRDKCPKLTRLAT